MQITKTDFLNFLECPSFFWISKKKPEIWEKHKGARSLFMEKLIREGYEVEEYVEKLFLSAKNLQDYNAQEVKEILKKETGKFFQATFSSEDGLFIRTDMIENHEDGSISIYEIKSSSYDKNKRESEKFKKRHKKDLAFQKNVLEKNGYKVKDLYLIYLDKEYIKDGEIDPEKIFHIENMNERIEKIYEKTQREIEAAIEKLKQEKINEDFCPCVENTRSNWCDTFSYFNGKMPEKSIYELYKIKKEKVRNLRDMEVQKILDIPEDFKLSDYQIIQKQSVDQDRPIIEHEEIKKDLDKLKFPLYFFDYETLPFAVPRIDGYWPHAQVPMQYSIHIMHENGEIEHKEYLAEKMENPIKLIEQMREDIGAKGSLISWYASFEKTRNKEMAKMFPKYEVFLNDINERTYDLMDIFKKDYIDRNFCGSASIKKVMPIIVPHLSYGDLDVQNGTMAVDATERLLITESKNPDEIWKKRKELLEYCKLDTWAMVEIYKALRKIVG